MIFYRIKQIGENEFIPQTQKRSILTIFTVWQGIESRNNLFVLWGGDYYQEKNCKVSSYEKALEVIEDYKKLVAEKSGYPKYHKVK
jgi:hypothetical protein